MRFSIPSNLLPLKSFYFLNFNCLPFESQNVKSGCGKAETVESVKVASKKADPALFLKICIFHQPFQKIHKNPIFS